MLPAVHAGACVLLVRHSCFSKILLALVNSVDIFFSSGGYAFPRKASTVQDHFFWLFAGLSDLGWGQLVSAQSLFASTKPPVFWEFSIFSIFCNHCVNHCLAWFFRRFWGIRWSSACQVFPSGDESDCLSLAWICLVSAGTFWDIPRHVGAVLLRLHPKMYEGYTKNDRYFKRIQCEPAQHTVGQEFPDWHRHQLERNALGTPETCRRRCWQSPDLQKPCYLAASEDSEMRALGPLRPWEYWLCCLKHLYFDDGQTESNNFGDVEVDMCLSENVGLIFPMKIGYIPNEIAI